MNLESHEFANAKVFITLDCTAYDQTKDLNFFFAGSTAGPLEDDAAVEAVATVSATFTTLASFEATAFAFSPYLIFSFKVSSS